MLVGDIMTRDVLTLVPEASVAEGLRLMAERGIHRLPVTDEPGELLGIVSDLDLRIAEAAGHLADPVRTVMTTSVVTVSEYAPLEEAAAIMRRKAISGLPVMRGNRIVGIVTSRDFFDVFARLLGADAPGVRITLILPNDRDVLLEILRGLRDRNGEIISLGMTKRGQDSLAVIKVSGLSEQEVERAVGVAGVAIADVLAEG
jgi:acetoin utilization protein AcuB